MATLKQLFFKTEEETFYLIHLFLREESLTKGDCGIIFEKVKAISTTLKIELKILKKSVKM